MVGELGLSADPCAQLQTASGGAGGLLEDGTLLSLPLVPSEPPALSRAWAPLCETALVLLPVSRIDATCLVRQTVDANVQRLIHQMRNNYLVRGVHGGWRLLLSALFFWTERR